jgi:signal transduction histidine kinase
VAWEMSFTIDIARSYEELQHLDEAKSNFISVVSHQMRTPVTISRCNLELALDKDVPKKDQAEALRAAYTGTVSLGRQLDQLLTVLEIEEKKLTVKKSPLDINSLIEKTVENNRADMKNKKIKLKLNLAQLVSPVKGDEVKIGKILDILTANAISYTPDKGQITISTSQNDLNNKKSLVVALADTGAGIKDTDQGNIFKKFFRSAEAKTMSPNGFGIDLYIARKFIKAHGGDIWFENSAADQGVTFFFSLPL